MAEGIKHLKAVRRYGTRYGRRNRDKVALVEVDQKRSHKCPKCAYPNVKRISVGIWQCSKCNAKFTSRAYTVSKPPAIKSLE
ncbi:TPA: 50S ribosomal protein L37ae [Candidatus Woesearchaeota archaeon]|nr:50S ribosomal protein L37ae [Candidatus Woesearchaeota archaeon]HIH31962.1 50S ribosomal protein L37ae [Candidatus Woesearchaeota archaeon]HIH54479.1 50S ribosomal protein L37ae [Candidatus Woesearchaeota archaeon]HIJ02120.1 50S ribosomal protein L37ae [Candidatus Woesearchaeota archaeon]HIJ13168.1 50S ribosomal protein L37ae [Candidatus Woesearchaeota archaeon]